MIVICMALAFVGFGIMDELAHHYDSITVNWIRSNPKFWDKRLSWMNKWKVTYNKGLPIVSDKEKFWGSSRWFVFLTDGWHLMQFISYQFTSMAIAFALCQTWWVALLLSLPIHAGCSTIKAVTMKTL